MLQTPRSALQRPAGQPDLQTTWQRGASHAERLLLSENIHSIRFRIDLERFAVKLGCQVGPQWLSYGENGPSRLEWLRRGVQDACDAFEHSLQAHKLALSAHAVGFYDGYASDSKEDRERFHHQRCAAKGLAAEGEFRKLKYMRLWNASHHQQEALYLVHVVEQNIWKKFMETHGRMVCSQLAQARPGRSDTSYDDGAEVRLRLKLGALFLSPHEFTLMKRILKSHDYMAYGQGPSAASIRTDKYADCSITLARQHLGAVHKKPSQLLEHQSAEVRSLIGAVKQAAAALDELVGAKRPLDEAVKYVTKRVQRQTDEEAQVQALRICMADFSQMEEKVDGCLSKWKRSPGPC